MNTNNLNTTLPTYLGKEGHPIEYKGKPLNNPYVRKTLSEFVRRLKVCEWLNSQLWPILVNVTKVGTSHCYSFYFEYKDEKHKFHIREFDANFVKSSFFTRLPLQAQMEAKSAKLTEDEPIFIINVTIPVI